MSVFDWYSAPKLRLTTSMEKWVGRLANFVSNHAFGNFSGRILSVSKDGQLVEIRTRAIPVSSNSAPLAAIFTNRGLTHGKMP